MFKFSEQVPLVFSELLVHLKNIESSAFYLNLDVAIGKLPKKRKRKKKEKYQEKSLKITTKILTMSSLLFEQVK